MERLPAIQRFSKTLREQEFTWIARRYGFLFVVSLPFKYYLLRFWRFAHSAVSFKALFTNGLGNFASDFEYKMFTTSFSAIFMCQWFYVCTRCNMQLAGVIRNIYDFAMELYSGEQICDKAHTYTHRICFLISLPLIELFLLSLFLTYSETSIHRFCRVSRKTTADMGKR
jgi:hypothetical protein